MRDMLRSKEDGYLTRICFLIVTLGKAPIYNRPRVYHSFQTVMIENLDKAVGWDEFAVKLDEAAIIGIPTEAERMYVRMLAMALNLRRTPFLSKKERCKFFDSMEKAITEEYYAAGLGCYLESVVERVQPVRGKYFVKVGRQYYNEDNYKDNGLIVKRNRFKYVDEMKRKREIEKITLGEKS